MKHSSTNRGDRLVSAVHVLGVNFLMGDKGTDESLHNHPAHLIAELAQSEEARLRLSLIPLLLKHPEYAAYIPVVAKEPEPSARLTVQCYDSGAVGWPGDQSLLQIKQRSSVRWLGGVLG